MAIKFLREKEKQETLIYLAVFLAIMALLVYFRGVDFNFNEPDITLEGRENFLEIRETLDIIESRQRFDRFRSFELIPPFGERPGRLNPFTTEGMTMTIGSDPGGGGEEEAAAQQEPEDFFEDFFSPIGDENDGADSVE